MIPQVVYLNPCPTVGIKVPILDDRCLPMMPTVYQPEATDLGFIPDPNRWRPRDYVAEVFKVAGTIFAGGVLPTLIVVLCFAWGA